MKRFVFQLQTALEWRQRRMESEQARFEELQARQAQLVQAKDAVERSWRESQEAVLGSKSVSAQELSALEGYRRAVENQKQRISRETVSLNESIGRQRHLLMESTREYRLLDKLRERRMEEWRKASEKDIELEAAELYLAQWKPES